MRWIRKITFDIRLKKGKESPGKSTRMMMVHTGYDTTLVLWVVVVKPTQYYVYPVRLMCFASLDEHGLWIRKMRNSSLQHHYEKRNFFDGLSFYISWSSFFTKADPQMPFHDNTLFNIVVPIFPPKLSLSEKFHPPPQWLGEECLNSPKRIFANSVSVSYLFLVGWA